MSEKEGRNSTSYRLNQTFSRFGTAVGNDIFIFKLDSFGLHKHCVLEESWDFVELLFESDVFAVAKGATVTLFDAKKSKKLGSVDCEKEVVRNVKLNKDVVVVVLHDQVKVFNPYLKEVYCYDSYDNPTGIVSLSADPQNLVLAFPSIQKGFIRVQFLSDEESRPKYISAHESSIACIALNSDGTLVATASITGTLIRVFHCVSGKLVKELRRGTKNAEITTIRFSPKNKYLLCSSTSGTVHLFSLTVTEIKDKRDTGGLVQNIISYASSERSVCKYHASRGRHVCAFGKNEKDVFVLNPKDGNCLAVEFDLKRGGKPVEITKYDVAKIINRKKKKKKEESP